MSARLFFLLLTLFFSAPNFALEKADAVVVKKSERALYLMKDGQVLKQYRIALGPRPQGHKLQEGDERTPEGNYILDRKNKHSRFYKSIHISYPNADDIALAWQYHVDPGDNVMIHGMKNSWNKKAAEKAQHFNWTDGCIAVSNSDMDEIWQAVDKGTPISILP